MDKSYDPGSVYGHDPDTGIARELPEMQPVRVRERAAGVCVHCGDHVEADHGGHLWATDLNDGHPLWCEPSPDKSHALS
jgi:hypothetical protein